MDFHIATRGLPAPSAPADPARGYTFHLSWTPSQPGWVLTIPRHQTGQSEFTADDRDQEAWVTALCARARWIEEVWYVTWLLDDWRRLAGILEPHRSSPTPQHLLAASLVYAAGDAEGRRRALQLCRQFPDDPVVRISRAEGLVRHERWDQAQRALRTLLARWPELAQGHALMSRVHRWRRRLRQAAASGWTAAILDADHLPTLSEVLVELQRSVPAADSLASWDRYLSLCAESDRPPDPYALANRAACRWALGDPDGAGVDLDLAIAGDPRCLWALRLRARLRAQVQDDPAGARADYAALHELWPSDQEAEAYLAR